MTAVALVGATDLLAQELREGLEARGLAGDLRLLAADEAEVGTLTEVAGAAAIVQPCREGDLDGVDVAFFCGAIGPNRPLLAQLSPATTAIVLSPDADAGDGKPVVAGVNGDAVHAGGVFLSPHPGAVLLAHLLAPLLPLAPERAVATVIQPASLRGKEGLDELFDQTRSILSFSSQRPEAVFGRQLAFSHYPLRPARGDVGEQVRQCLRQELPVTAQLLQGGAFHGLSASLFVRFGDDPEAGALRDALAGHPPLEILPAGAQQPAPVDVAARPDILVGALEPDPHEPGSWWLWGVLDNLTAGGALNALAIAEAALAEGATAS